MTITLDWSQGIPADATDQIAGLVTQLTRQSLNRLDQQKRDRESWIYATAYSKPAQAFELFEARDVSIMEVNEVLGTDVGTRYAAWLAQCATCGDHHEGDVPFGCRAGDGE